MLYRLFVAAVVLYGLVGSAFAQTAVDADFDGDGTVDFQDFLAFVGHFGTSTGDANYNAKYDIDNNGEVRFSDFLIFVGFFGQTTRPNQLPIANAGEDQSVDKREMVTLNGANSSDPEGQPLIFSWRQIEGTSVALSDPKIAHPTFTTREPGNYAFELVVNDGVAASMPDTVVVDIVSIADVAVKVGSPDATFMYKATTGNQATFAVQGATPQVQVGEVMVNTVEPYFIKKVTRVVSQNATEIVVETEDAALTDVIEQASIRRSFRVPTTKLTLASPTTLGDFPLYTDSSVTLHVTNCGISFSPIYEYALNIVPPSHSTGFVGEIDSFKVEVRGVIVASLGMKLEASQAFSQNVKEKEVADYVVSAPVMRIGWVPLPINVRVSVAVGATFSAEAPGSISTDIIIRKPYTVSAKYEDIWQSTIDVADGIYEAQDPTVKLQSEAKLRGYVRGQLEANLSGLVSPHIVVIPYADFVAKTNLEEKRIDWALKAGGDGSFGVEAAILYSSFGKETSESNWDFNFDMTLLKEGFLPLPSDRHILVELYNATDGANWEFNTNWLSDRPVYRWYGINRYISVLEHPIYTERVGYLDLSDNQLSGRIPASLGDLDKLLSLVLSGNQLSGSIPKSLGNLSLLGGLGLFDNQLSGSIPGSLGNLDNLRFLGLSNNQLSGSIPLSLVALDSLQILLLGYNQLSGRIPIFRSPNLQILALSHNQLSGPIPIALGNLDSLRSLDLSNNQLSGPIPVELGYPDSLGFLDLSNNQLSGPIPTSILHLAALEFFYADDSVCVPNHPLYDEFARKHHPYRCP